MADLPDKKMNSSSSELCEPQASPAKPAKKKQVKKSSELSKQKSAPTAKKPAANSSSGQPQADPPAANGRAKPDPPAKSLTAGTAKSPELVQPGLDSRLSRLESMFERVMESMERPQRRTHSQSRSDEDQEDNISIFSESEADQRDSVEPRRNFRPRGQSAPVIDLADNSSVANFLSSNDDADSVFSMDMADHVDSQGRTKDKSEFKIPMLAQKFAAPSDIGQPLDEDLADTITFMMGQKLDKKQLDDASARYLCPGNCSTLVAPKVNPTIWDNMKTSTRRRDLRLQMVQSSLVKGINAFAQSLPSGSIPSEQQQDALAFLCDANFALNCLRKDCIKPDMNPAFHHLCKPQHKVTKLLFGEDLGRQVKEITEERKTMSGIMRQKFGKDQRYNPYNKKQESHGGFPSSSTHQSRRDDHSYKPNRKSASSTGQPFLGKTWPPHQKGKYKDPPPHTYTPSAAAGRDTSRHQHQYWPSQRK